MLKQYNTADAAGQEGGATRFGAASNLPTRRPARCWSGSVCRWLRSRRSLLRRACLAAAGMTAALAVSSAATGGTREPGRQRGRVSF